jgi:uncharacterized membrane protein YfcA
MSPLLLYPILAISILVTSFISGILGMAGGMILMGVLLALMPVPAAMMMHGVTQFASNGWRAWLWRRDVNWRVFRGNAYGSIVVLVVFAVVQLSVSKPIAYFILGATPFVSFFLPADQKLNVDRRGHSFLCGLICMSLSLLAGVSGPLLDVFFLHSKMDRKGVVATKAISQALGHVLKIVYFGALLATAHGTIEWWQALAAVLLAMSGTSLSRKVLEGMSDAAFRKWTRGTVLVIGTFYLLNAVWLMVGRG